MDNLILPWYEHEEYISEIPADFVLTEEEQEIKRLYRLNDRQLSWRRLIIARDYKGRAFIQTGISYLYSGGF